MKKILSLIALSCIFACDLSYCMQEEKSPYEQRLKERVEKWNDNSAKADLLVSCIDNVRDNGTARVLKKLKIRKDGWSYEIHSDGTMYQDSKESPKPDLNKSGYYVIEKGSKKFSIGITPTSSSQPWVNVDINERGAGGDIKTTNIGWKQKEGLLIVHGANLDGSCAFGGQYVHMVDDKELSNDNSKPNKFLGGLTVFATHGFINFSPLYFKPDAIHIISPSSVNYGYMTDQFGVSYQNVPSLTRYAAFSAKYPDLLHNWIACHKGFHNFGKIDVAGCVHLEDLPTYVAGSFTAESVTMSGENNFLQFGDSDFKNVMLDARNQYFDPEIRYDRADYDSGKYEVNIDCLNGVERVFLPAGWGYRQNNDTSLNIDDTYAYVNVKHGVSNIEKMACNLLSAGDSEKWFKSELYFGTSDDMRVILDPVKEALRQRGNRLLDNETICTAGLYMTTKAKGSANFDPLPKNIILNAINEGGKFDYRFYIGGLYVEDINCEITKKSDDDTIDVCLKDSNYSDSEDPELSNFCCDLFLNLIKRISNDGKNLKSPFMVRSGEDWIYSYHVLGYLLGEYASTQSIEPYKKDNYLKLKLGKTTVADREYLTEFRPLEKSDIMRNEFLARVYFDFGNEEANQNIYAMTIRCVIAPDGKVYAGEYRTGTPLTKDATVWLAESLSSLKDSEQENGFEQRKIILEKALDGGKVSLKTEDGLKCENIVGEKKNVSSNKWMELAEQGRMYATILAAPDDKSQAIEIPIWFKAINGGLDYIFFDSISGQPFNAWIDKNLSNRKIMKLINVLFKQQPAVQPQPSAEEKEDKKKDIAAPQEQPQPAVQPQPDAEEDNTNQVNQPAAQPQEQPQPDAEEEEVKDDVKPSQKPIYGKHFEVKISDIMPQGGRMMNIKDNH